MYLRFVVLFVLFVTVCLGSDSEDLVQFVKDVGYHLTEHEVETSDQYHLGYHRLQKTSTPSTGVPVLLKHGLAMSSAAFLTPSKDALAYLLLETGFDVWLANSRGNRYSRRNRVLDATDSRFWQFSIDELATSDLPAGIDYILKATNSTKLAVVGHSHGAALALALLASRPDRQASVEAVVALAPAVYLDALNNATEGPLLVAKQIIGSLAENSSKVPHNLELSTFSEIEERLCITGKENCKNILNLLQGTTSEESWKTISKFLPAGTSLSFIEYVNQQLLNGEHFMKHDYGAEVNKNYINGQLEEYDLTKIDVPVHIVYSDEDMFIPPKGILYLKNQLKNSTTYPIQNEKFNHLDFLWGNETKLLVFQEVVKFLNQIKDEELSQRSVMFSRSTIKHFYQNSTSNNGESPDRHTNDIISHNNSVFGNNGMFVSVTFPKASYSHSSLSSSSSESFYSSKIKEIINLTSCQFSAFIKRIKQHRNYIKREFNIDVNDFKNKAHLEKLIQLIYFIDNKSYRCQAECSEIRDILINIGNINKPNGTSSKNSDTLESLARSEITQIYIKIMEHSNYIQKTLKIYIGNFNNENEILRTLKKVFTKIDALGSNCVSACSKVRYLLSLYFLKIAYYNIILHEAYIQNTFNIFFVPTGDEKKRWQKLKSLSEKIKLLGTNCVSECIEVRTWLDRYFTCEINYIFYQTITEKTYIQQNFNIVLSEIYDLNTRFDKLMELFKKVKQLRKKCDRKCVKLRFFLKDYLSKYNIQLQSQESSGCKQLNSAQNELQLTDLLEKILQYKVYIRNAFNIEILEYEDKYSSFKKINKLFGKIRKQREICSGNCREVFKLLINFELSSTFQQIFNLKTYILKHFNVLLNNVYNVNNSVGKLKNVLNEIKLLGIACRKECRTLQSLLQCYFQLKTELDTFNEEPSNFQDNKAQSKKQVNDLLQRIRQYKVYIRNNFNIDLIENEDTYSSFKKINYLFDKIRIQNEGCSENCREVFKALIDFELSSTFTNISNYKSYILKHFNLLFKTCNNENNSVKKLKILLNKIQKLGMACREECSAIHSLLEYFFQLKIQQQFFTKKVNYTQDNSTKSESHFTDLLQRIRQYKEYIRNAFNVEINGNEDEDSSFKKINSLFDEIRKKKIAVQETAGK